MSLLPKIVRGPGGLKAIRGCYGLRLGWLIWPSLACLAVFVIPAAAQDVSHTKKKRGCGSAPAQRPQRQKVIAGVDNARTFDDKTAVGRRRATPVQASSKQTGGSPRWVCPEPDVKIDPVWYGDRIECAFMIRNEGDADLRIKASGG